MRRTDHILIVLLLLLCAVGASAQSKTELEKQKEQLLQDIKFTNKLLDETEEDRKATLSELNLLSSKINKRQELINTILREIDLIEKQIRENREIVASLESDLKNLKEEYALMLYHSYKNRNQYDRLMFILSADDFNQAYKRIQYFQQYAKHRQQQAEAIEATQDVLQERNEELADKKMKMAYLVEDKEKEKIKLSTEKEEQDRMVQELSKKEKELRADLKKKQRDAEKLEKAISRIIEEEIRKAKKKAEKTGGTTTRSGFALTPTELALSGKFSTDVGKMPWPAERGVITSSFGEHPHPTLRDIKIVNNGIDITTDKNLRARAVYEGKVSAVVSIPGAHKTVILRHGEYLTVYSNLENVLVKMGDTVGVKQELGTVFTSREDGKTVLHFEVWKGANKLNPAKWIVREK